MNHHAIRIRESEPIYKDGFVWELHGWRHELFIEEDVASSLIVTDHEMRIGASSVHVGGIQAVGTSDKRRNKGLARQVIAQSNDWMAEFGFDAATLFGIDDFYHRFGYAVVMPDCQYTVRTRDAEQAQSPLICRPYEEKTDLPAVREIYEANNRERTGTFLRRRLPSGAEEPFFRKGSWYGVIPERFVFTDDTGAIRAYLVADKNADKVILAEAGAVAARDHAAILQWAAAQAIVKRLETMTFHAPPDGALSEALALYGATAEIALRRDGAGGGQILAMARLLNVPSFFAKTCLEWTRRVAQIPPGRVRLITDIPGERGSVTLDWNGTEISAGANADAKTVVTLPQSRLIQLAMGHHSAAFALGLPDVAVTGDVALFIALFPQRWGHLWRTDHY